MQGQRIGYVRVSTIDQHTERQLEGIEVAKNFTDKASGKDTKRPQLEELMSFERSGRGGYGLPLGGAAFFPVGRDALQIGETGLVHMRLYGLAALDDELRVGARFMLTEGGDK